MLMKFWEANSSCMRLLYLVMKEGACLIGAVVLLGLVPATFSLYTHRSPASIASSRSFMPLVVSAAALAAASGCVACTVHAAG